MKKYASILSVLIVVLTVYWSFYDMMPNSDKINIKGGFSIENALTHLKAISKKSHHVGTEAHKEVQAYIVKELEAMNLSPEIQTQTAVYKKWYAGTTAENILARIKGSGNGKALMLLSHYDSNPHSAIGASDAGSGVVTILEGIRAFLAENSKPKNDIIILISDAEELGLLGAKAFVDNHPWVKDVGLVLNFEARGSGGPSYMLMETNGKNSKLIGALLEAGPNYLAANSLMYSVYKKLPNDTDLTVFREEADINGFNFAFIGDHFDYHTAQDSYERLDRETLAHQADYLMNSLYYFANTDLSSLNSDQDYVYVNFPFMQLLSYPFSWIMPLLIAAIIIFLILLFFGRASRKILIKDVLKGFAAFILAIVICGGLSMFLWKGLVLIHPQYQDMLHGFTYNGYTYIAAFSFLNVWLLYAIYKRVANDQNSISLLVAPITIWLIINFLIQGDYKGAGFLIIPVYIALLIMGISIFGNMKKKYTILFAILSIPTIYMIAPMVKLFPVGLGLRNLLISGVLISLLFGLLLPVLLSGTAKRGFARIAFILMLVFFIKASFSAGFSEEKKRPNSLVYVHNIDTGTAYWGSYNTTLDDYIKQKLGENPTQGGIPNADTKSKYNTRFNYHVAADFKAVPSSEISISKDTIISGSRIINFMLRPKRTLNKLEFISEKPIHFDSLKVNSARVNSGEPFDIRRGTFLRYHMANQDSVLNVSMSVKKDSVPRIIINEISYDLLSNPLFNIKPRSKDMMPMPFVTNDAIISIQQLKL
ncbi:M20/M25/M40 family metallo-hydrolase [Flavobacteriaceae bacterium S356]|uniref:Vacuolar membrane protease n=1 Tax=Asprobacillus argus TaxID=3076534 RepID=A0ABU3LDS7_9FLAO|nr:M20/M25/M40 family metallo-hydrolase [Flavobacteriaceae bacterium S356]